MIKIGYKKLRLFLSRETFVTMNFAIFVGVPV